MGGPFECQILWYFPSAVAAGRVDQVARQRLKFGPLYGENGSYTSWNIMIRTDFQCSYRFWCVCQLGAGPSPEYIAAVAHWHWPKTWSTIVAFGIINPIIWVLPALILLCYRGFKRCSRSASSERQAGHGVSGVPVDRRTRDLAAAEAAAVKLRMRVGGAVAQLGWIIVVVSVTPTVMNRTAIPLFASVESNLENFLGPLPWGIALCVLALRPIDAALIRVACLCWCCFCLFWASVSALYIAGAVTEWINKQSNIMIVSLAFNCIQMALFYSCAVCMFPTLPGDCCRFHCPESVKMPPRRQLRRLWLTIRVALVVRGVSIAYYAIHTATLWQYLYLIYPYIFPSISFIVTGLISTPANRGRFIALLSKLLSSGGDALMQAASVAALLGGRGAAATLAMGAGCFRALPLNSLTREELANSKPDPELFKKTVSAKLDEVHAFASHSWSDDGNAKYDALHDWAASGGGKRQIWLDKVCALCLSRPCASASAHAPASLPHRRASTNSTSTRRSRAYPSSSRAASSCSSSPAPRTRRASGA